MFANRITVEWWRNKSLNTSSVSCIRVNPPILLTHDQGESLEQSKWVKQSTGQWWNAEFEGACKPFNEALDRALVYFQPMDIELESIILGEQR